MFYDSNLKLVGFFLFKICSFGPLSVINHNIKVQPCLSGFDAHYYSINVSHFGYTGTNSISFFFRNSPTVAMVSRSSRQYIRIFGDASPVEPLALHLFSFRELVSPTLALEDAIDSYSSLITRIRGYPAGRAHSSCQACLDAGSPRHFIPLCLASAVRLAFGRRSLPHRRQRADVYMRTTSAVFAGGTRRHRPGRDKGGNKPVGRCTALALWLAASSP